MTLLMVRNKPDTIDGRKPFARKIFVDVLQTFFFDGPTSLASTYQDSSPEDDHAAKMLPDAMLAMVATGVRFHDLSSRC